MVVVVVVVASGVVADEDFEVVDSADFVVVVEGVMVVVVGVGSWVAVYELDVVEDIEIEDSGVVVVVVIAELGVTADEIVVVDDVGVDDSVDVVVDTDDETGVVTDELVVVVVVVSFSPHPSITTLNSPASFGVDLDTLIDITVTLSIKLGTLMYSYSIVYGWLSTIFTKLFVFSLMTDTLKIKVYHCRFSNIIK